MCQLSNMNCWFILKCVVFVATQHLNDNGFLDIFINCNQAMKNATTKVMVPGTRKNRQIPAQLSLHCSVRNQYVKFLCNPQTGLRNISVYMFTSSSQLVLYSLKIK